MKALYLLLFSAISIVGSAQIQLDSLLFACYPLDGNAGDSSGNANHGLASGPFATVDRFNNSNSAYFFDGADDWIQVGNVLSVPNQSAVTISMWIYPQLISGAINRNVSIQFGSKDVGQLTLRVQEENLPHFQANLVDAYANNTSFTRSDNSFDYDTWYHVVGVYTDNYVNLYVNGAQQNDSQNKGTGGKLSGVPSNAELNIGKLYVWNSPVSYHYFHGKLDDIKIYTRELSFAEITALYQNNYNCSGTITGISDEKDLNQNIQVFPNPVINNLQIAHSLSELPNLELFNVQGQIVMSRTNLMTNEYIDLSNLTNGVYTARFSNANGQSTKRIVVSH
ncbi:MAG: LamG-like jellyroll fold domain-containing protein [Vicingaceae bacterium]